MQGLRRRFPLHLVLRAPPRFDAPDLKDWALSAANYAIKWHREEKREERAKVRSERTKQPSIEPVGARKMREQ